MPAELTFRRVHIPSPRTASARRAAVIRHGGTRKQVDALTAELRAANLKAHIESVMSEWPPLTEQQRATLAAMLAG